MLLHLCNLSNHPQVRIGFIPLNDMSDVSDRQDQQQNRNNGAR
jgi:hypothetical protein